MEFLLILLVIAIIVIIILASHNNDVDARVKALADAERQHLQNAQKKFIESKNQEYNKLCTKAQTEYEAATKLKQEYQDIMNKIDSIIQQKINIYPHLAAVMSDILTAYFENSARYLENKPHPALTEAFRIRQLRQDTQKIIEEKKILEYQIAYIRQMIPNIDDLLDSGFIDNDAEFEVESEETTDRVRFFLSPEEYKNLSSIERNQLALDRYIAGRKSKWQVGRDYEMYIGHLYENKGCSVEYMGIIKGLEDLGRDLIVKKDKKTSIIQCKNWSKEKTIHEKHIFQLFGTVVLYNIEHPNAEAKGIFISTTALSDTALQVAQELGIQTVQKDIGNFPRIKCNINRTTGEKIDHLPFDQQYDSVVIEKNKGEFYALTIDQAERQGFRRAFRHYI